jgi:hypothetical protein
MNSQIINNINDKIDEELEFKLFAIKNNLDIKLGKKKGFIIDYESDDEEPLPILTKTKKNFLFPDEIWIIIKQFTYHTECSNCQDENPNLKYKMAWNKYYQNKSDMITEQLLCKTCADHYCYQNCNGCSQVYSYTELIFYKPSDYCAQWASVYCNQCDTSINNYYKQKYEFNEEEDLFNQLMLEANETDDETNNEDEDLFNQLMLEANETDDETE